MRIIYSNTIGERIETARKAKGMTRKDLAEALGLTYVAVLQWETKKRLPYRKNVAHIAEILGVTERSLLEDPRPGQAISAWKITKDGRLYCANCGKASGWTEKQLLRDAMPDPPYCGWCDAKMLLRR